MDLASPLMWEFGISTNVWIWHLHQASPPMCRFVISTNIWIWHLHQCLDLASPPMCGFVISTNLWICPLYQYIDLASPPTMCSRNVTDNTYIFSIVLFFSSFSFFSFFTACSVPIHPILQYHCKDKMKTLYNL